MTVPFNEDDLVTHTKTGNVYRVMGVIHVKIDGQWVECQHYASTDGSGQGFARRPDDMRSCFTLTHRTT